MSLQLVTINKSSSMERDGVHRSSFNGCYSCNHLVQHLFHTSCYFFLCISFIASPKHVVWRWLISIAYRRYTRQHLSTPILIQWEQKIAQRSERKENWDSSSSLTKWRWLLIHNIGFQSPHHPSAIPPIPPLGQSGYTAWPMVILPLHRLILSSAADPSGWTETEHGWLIG